jgi:hypothetical protein
MFPRSIRPTPTRVKRTISKRAGATASNLCRVIVREP